MKNSPKRDKRSNLEKEIDSLIETLNSTQPASEDYAKISDNLKKLYEAKATLKSKKPSADTVLTVAGSLMGIVLLMSFEKASIITTKALGFILRPRV